MMPPSSSSTTCDILGLRPVGDLPPVSKVANSKSLIVLYSSKEYVALTTYGLSVSYGATVSFATVRSRTVLGGVTGCRWR